MGVVLFKGAFLFLGSSYRRTSPCLSSPTWIYPEEFGDNGYQFFPSPAIGSSNLVNPFADPLNKSFDIVVERPIQAQ
jgi:hypothetical protein